MDRRCLAQQHQKGGLKSVLSIMAIAQDTATNTEHHRAVPAHQGREGGFLALDQKSIEQLAVCQTVRIVEEHAPVKVPEQAVRGSRRHKVQSVGGENPFPPTIPSKGVDSYT